MVSEINFNYNSNEEEFNKNKESRIVSISHMIDDEGKKSVILSFNLGRKEEDFITLIFDSDDFVKSFVRALIDTEYI